MRILVLGDSYCPQPDVAAGARGPARSRGHLRGRHRRTRLATRRRPRTSACASSWAAPTRSSRPSTGTTSWWSRQPRSPTEVMDACPQLKLVCVARGGPVNVDLEAATARGIPVVTTPGKNATAVAELTIAAMIMRRPTHPRDDAPRARGRRAVRGQLRGRPLVRPRARGPCRLASSASGRSAGASRSGRWPSACACSPATPSWRRRSMRAAGAEPVELDELLAMAGPRLPARPGHGREPGPHGCARASRA